MATWNNEQLQAIAMRQGNVLVSASAGTGKTTTMLERVMRSIRDENARLSDFLIVTFTEKSAFDMKEKLRKRLMDYLSELPQEQKEWLRDEIDLLALADIGTIHSFCLSLIKRYFNELEISPQISVLDADSATLLKAEALDKAIEEYQNKSPDEFAMLCRRFNLSKKGDNLCEYVNSVYDFLLNQPQRLNWLRQAIEKQSAISVDQHPLLILTAQRIAKQAERLAVRLREIYSEYSNVEIGINKRVLFMLERLNYFEGVTCFRELYGGMDWGRLPKLGAIEDEQLALEMETISASYTALRLQIVGIQKADGGDVQGGYENEKAGYAQMVRNLNIIESLVISYDEAYTELKQSRSMLDYSDLEHLTVKLIDKPEILEEIAQKYKYVYVDEYQDVSPVQEYVLSKIGEGKSFMVGDVKQSIYLFRNADPEIMLRKSKAYSMQEGGFELRFNTNYRSDQAVLSFVNSVFSVLMTTEFGGEDYKTKSQLCSDVHYEKVNDLPAVNILQITRQTFDDEKVSSGLYSVMEDSVIKEELSNASLEGVYIARQIKEIVGKKKIYIPQLNSERLIKYSDIMILFRTKKGATIDVLRELSNAEIPVVADKITDSGINFDVDLLVTVLKLSINGSDDVGIITYLRNPLLIGLSDNELAEIKRGSNTEFFYQAARIATQRKDGLGEKVRYAYAVLDEIRFVSGFLCVSDVMYRLIDLLDFREKLIARPKGSGRWFTLDSYVSSLTANGYNNDVLAYINAYDKIADEIKYVLPGGSDLDAVSAMTMHAAKGLEAPIVFIADIEHLFNLRDDSPEVVLDSDYGIVTKYYSDEKKSSWQGALHSELKNLSKKQKMEEEMRLLYVALTRARNHLFIVGTENDFSYSPESTPQSYRSFLDWLLYCEYKDRNIAQYFDVDICNRDREILQALVVKNERRLWAPQAPDRTSVNKLKEQYEYQYPYKEVQTMSIKYAITQINSIEETEFALPSLYEEELASKGTDYHKILQYISFGLTTFDEVKQELERLRDEGLITTEQYQGADARKLLKILTMPLMKYASRNKTEREKPFMLYVEANKVMQTDVTEKILVQGVFDLLILGDENILVDYKNSFLSEQELIQRYKKQLELYAFSCEQLLGITISKKVILNINKICEIEI